MKPHEDLKTSAIAVVGFVGTTIVVAIVFMLMVIFYQAERRQALVKDIGVRPQQVTELTADQKGTLASYGWIDQEKGIVHIPVSRAKELVLAEILKDPAAATPVVTRPPETKQDANDSKQGDAASEKPEESGESEESANDASSPGDAPSQSEDKQTDEKEKPDGR